MLFSMLVVETGLKKLYTVILDIPLNKTELVLERKYLVEKKVSFSRAS